MTAEELPLKKPIARTVIAIICRAEGKGEPTEGEAECGSCSPYLKARECFCTAFSITPFLFQMVWRGKWSLLCCSQEAQLEPVWV